MEFLAERALMKGPDFFKRFSVPDRVQKLRDAHRDQAETLLVVERGGERRAFLLTQMAYHHVAQGTLGGQPYAFTF